jgi:quercetin dioxygenase-like cupin family protein
MAQDSAFSYNKNLLNLGLLSLDIYHIKPLTKESRHFHKGIEILYILKGNCKTHKEGKIYFYKSTQIHEVVNDSKEEVNFLCLTIPPESDKNTVYL